MLGIACRHEGISEAYRSSLLEEFYTAWKDYALVIDLWFNLQAQSPLIKIAGLKALESHVQAFEAWIIDTLASFGVSGQRRDDHPGIWVAGDGELDKIAAIGVRISRWVSWHGIAINLDPDLTAFERIIPCGVRDGGVTSLAAQGITCDLKQLDASLATCFERHFPDLPA